MKISVHITIGSVKLIFIKNKKLINFNVYDEK